MFDMQLLLLDGGRASYSSSSSCCCCCSSILKANPEIKNKREFPRNSGI
jgi:hypothetical protein